MPQRRVPSPVAHWDDRAGKTPSTAPTWMAPANRTANRSPEMARGPPLRKRTAMRSARAGSRGPKPGKRRGSGSRGGRRSQTQNKLASAVNNFYGSSSAPDSTFGTPRKAVMTGRPVLGRAAHQPGRRLCSRSLCAASPVRGRCARTVQGQRYRACRAGTGKAPGAVALLRQVTDGSLWALSPTVTLNELAEREFVRGPVMSSSTGSTTNPRATSPISPGGPFVTRSRTPGRTLSSPRCRNGRGRTAESGPLFRLGTASVRDLLATYLAGTGAVGLDR